MVVATHFPIFDRAGFFARLVPVRENCVAGVVDEARAPKDALRRIGGGTHAPSGQ